MFIKLHFELDVDQQLENKVPNRGYVIRLTSAISFKTKNGWTNPYLAIIDTGAHITVIPKRIWSKSVVNILDEHKMAGIVPKEECSTQVQVGEMHCRLTDGENYTKDIGFLCYMTSENNIPLIIGFKEILEKFKVFFDYTTNVAFIAD
ncbi:MAG: hypothetical protein ACE5KT_11380 [Methanosarcinales archaeon]